ncbi:MAG TPA: DUF2007 domain-containing protein [Pirellulaceae bacterium]|jgi:hypothetical protein
MSRQPTIIYSADNPQQAHLLRSLLEDEGIQAWVVNDAIQIAGGELPIGWRAAAKVVVKDEQAAAAREFAEAFDHKAQQHFFEPSAQPDDSADDNSLTPQSAWPVCPTCNEPRSARCPICGESGVNFPAAYSDSDHQNHQPLFLCPSCDDPISPEWYRLCARCSHDFGAGLEIKKTEPAGVGLTVRTLIVLVALLWLVAAIAAYFFWLFTGGRA